jgi:hypothetical protein
MRHVSHAPTRRRSDGHSIPTHVDRAIDVESRRGVGQGNFSQGVFDGTLSQDRFRIQSRETACPIRGQGNCDAGVGVQTDGDGSLLAV